MRKEMKNFLETIKRNIKLLLVIVLIAIPLTSCVTVISKNPLGDVPSSIMDRDLLGVWRYKGEFLVILEKEDNFLQFIFLSSSFEHSEGFQGFMSEIDGERYLNLILDDDGYTLAHYQIRRKNKLTISFFDPDFFEKAIKDGLIQGDSDAETLTLTDSTDNIVKFIQSIQSHKKEEFLGDIILFYKKIREGKKFIKAAEKKKEETKKIVEELEKV